jgi:hypothetical protein
MDNLEFENSKAIHYKNHRFGATGARSRTGSFSSKEFNNDFSPQKTQTTLHPLTNAVVCNRTDSHGLTYHGKMSKNDGSREDVFVGSVVENPKPSRFYATSQAGFRNYGEITEDNRKMRALHRDARKKGITLSFRWHNIVDPPRGLYNSDGNILIDDLQIGKRKGKRDQLDREIQEKLKSLKAGRMNWVEDGYLRNNNKDDQEFKGGKGRESFTRNKDNHYTKQIPKRATGELPIAGLENNHSGKGSPGRSKG